MKINFAIVCYKMRDDKNAEVKHICCYETEPSMLDVNRLKEELATDEEFGMVGDEDYEMTLLDRSTEPDQFEELGIPAEIEEENG